MTGESTRQAGGPRPVRGGSGRGQTGFDFLVGMSVFLITVGLVVGFAPSMFEPFDTDTGTAMVASGRSAASLAEDALVESPTRPGVLDTDCTAELFDGDSSVPGDCRYGTEDLHDLLGLGSTTGVNVTIEEDGAIRTITHDGSPVDLASGPEADHSESVVVYQRLVLLDGTESTLFVRAW